MSVGLRMVRGRTKTGPWYTMCVPRVARSYWGCASPARTRVDQNRSVRRPHHLFHAAEAPAASDPEASLELLAGVQDLVYRRAGPEMSVSDHAPDLLDALHLLVEQALPLPREVRG